MGADDTVLRFLADYQDLIVGIFAGASGYAAALISSVNRMRTEIAVLRGQQAEQQKLAGEIARLKVRIAKLTKEIEQHGHRRAPVAELYE